MFKKLKSLFFSTPKIILGKGKNSYHAIHGGWGDHIEFFDNDTSSTIRKIWGHSEDNIQNFSNR
jgi:hypothetical protein